MPSVDLGELISLTVKTDAAGNAPSWCLSKIIVTSTFFKGAKIALFNQTVDSTTPVTQLFIK